MPMKIKMPMPKQAKPAEVTPKAGAAKMNTGVQARLSAALGKAWAMIKAIGQAQNNQLCLAIKILWWALGLSLCLATLPWLFSKSVIPTILGLVALAIGIAVTQARGQLPLYAFSLLMLLLAVIVITCSPPNRPPVQLGSVALIGFLKILLYATPIIAGLVFALSKLEKIIPKPAPRAVPRPAAEPPQKSA